MLAVWEWAGELERATGCAVQMSVYRSNRLGVWRCTVRLLELVDNRPAGIRHQVHGEFPNSSRSYLGDYLLALVMQLDSRSAQALREPPREA